MGAKSQIQWTDATWTPLRARVRPDAREIATAKGYTSLLPVIHPGKVGPHCEHISPGCVNCYSETNNGRCLPNNGTGLPFNRQARELVETFLDEKILAQPLHWRAAKKIFVCSQTDLFGEWVTDEQIDRVFAVMALCPQHTFQVLTKRAERMRDYLNAPGICERIAREANVFMRSDKAASNSDALHQLFTWARLDNAQPGEYVNYLAGITGRCWPLHNVWLGVSVEDQQRADERIPLLLQTPAAVRWISAEPLLGPVDINVFVSKLDWGTGPKEWPDGLSVLDWVVVGGESGPGARPMNIAWAERLVEDCRNANVAVFVKQLGARVASGNLPRDARPWDIPARAEWPWVQDVKGGWFWPHSVGFGYSLGNPPVIIPFDKKGGDISEFPPALQVRQWPETTRA